MSHIVLCFPPRAKFAALLISLLASSIHAQQEGAPLQSGAIYALRSSSGKYLSAHANPTQQVGLAPHVAGWEQWQYLEAPGGGRRFVSYHGTTFIISESDGALIHAPWHPVFDQGFSIEGVEIRVTPAGQQLGISTNPVVGGRIALVRRRDASTVLVLAETASGIGAQYQTSHNISPTAGYPLVTPVTFPNQWWTIVPVAAPDANRQRQATDSVGNAMTYFLRSEHGTILAPGEYRGVKTDDYVVNLVPSTSQVTRTRVQAKKSPVDTFPITFGQPLHLNFLTDVDNRSFYLAPGTSFLGMQTLLLTPITSDWTFSDPTGRYRTGERVPIGAPVLLVSQSTGKVLAAQIPGQPTLVPQGSPWVRWVVATSK